ncbi:hypothetical protein HN512_02110 [Candidatus Peregrinibacteria bacterium]|jgi:hypothetical protein|nr:hypothetical protein [Candidatus Peregrinibacteria bacterium]MBT3598608.1 hypothetical protein [Candidatus Peregrinibacteria bacterium]MBT4367023.1 hypothetical protein [Candidatus Peregrinibacteria bacterium]MBT4586128.1 hypothetical protein [Candidatus Peregrinibacteria bacterium]MBT6730603.1 hypothetical protein [Candidatus Peregrinibacteria bacterium]
MPEETNKAEAIEEIKKDADTDAKKVPAKKKTKRKPKSTVRKSKGNKHSSTQRYLPIAEIRNNTVLLKNGGLRAVLEVEALNFNLKSETEQQGIIAGYQSFINSITFPIQIVVRSRRVNIAPYLKEIKLMAKNQKNPLLKKQTESYAMFVEKVVEVADIMKKKFYVIVPLDDQAIQQKKSTLRQLFSWLQIDDSGGRAVQRYKSFVSKHTKLIDRLNLVQSGLNSIGLITHRLNTKELIELYYETYNPHASAVQKLNEDLNLDQFAI